MAMAFTKAKAMLGAMFVLILLNVKKQMESRW